MRDVNKQVMDSHAKLKQIQELNQKTSQESEMLSSFSVQHELLHKQIVAFEKLLQHAMNRFSRDKLIHMLKVSDVTLQHAMNRFSRDKLIHMLEYLSKWMLRHDQLEATADIHIQSVQHLKTVVHDIEQRLQGQSIKKQGHVDQETDDQRHLVHYFSTFFEDLQYLRELKRYFDEKVYICLYEYFYDPTDDVDGQFGVTSQKQDDDSISINSLLSPSEPELDRSTPVVNNNQAESEAQDPTTEEEIVFDFLSKQAKLSVAVQKMYKVNRKWGLILDESDPHLSAYDPDSKHELSLYPQSELYEPVMRLLPDIFVKAYKSIELAKLWWAQAQKLYANKPLRKRTVTELVKQEVEIEHHIVKIAADVERFEATLLTRSDDLKKLSEREERFTSLSEQRHSLEQRKDVATHDYNMVQVQVESMTKELQLYEEGSKEYTELEKRLKVTDQQLALTKDELKILAYHFHIVQEDFQLELELQPHLIRFRADIEEKTAELKRDLRAKHSEKRATQKKLVLLKANCERMREIMQRYRLHNDGLESPETSRENTDSFLTEAKPTKKPTSVKTGKTAPNSSGQSNGKKNASTVKKQTVKSAKKTAAAS